MILGSLTLVAEVAGATMVEATATMAVIELIEEVCVSTGPGA